MRVVTLLMMALNAVSAVQASAPDLYRAGEQALRAGDLASAEQDFRAVLKQHPQDPGALANLGVIFMRRSQWDAALEELNAAEKLAPQVAGVRLNIGLVYFRRGDYQAALPAFQSVADNDAGSVSSTQAQYLLGLCYFLLERYPDAQRTLAPLWDAQSSNLQYLYMLGIAAGKTGDAERESAALQRLQSVGRDSPELHLWAGKAFLARGDDRNAAAELQQAAAAGPKLPFVHYYLGVLERKRQEVEKARADFLTDRAISPDTPFDDQQLGEMCAMQGETRQAEEYFRRALRIQPRLATARYELAKLFRAENRLPEALAEIERVSATDGESPSSHYLQAQILAKLGRSKDAAREYALSARLRNRIREDLEQKISGESARDVEILAPTRQ